MKKEYEKPDVTIMEIVVERGFAASATIDNPDEVEEAYDYWT